MTYSKNEGRRKKKLTPDMPVDYTFNGHTPPQALQIEDAILGVIMLERQAIDAVSSMLPVEAFYRDSNQRVYRAILELHKESRSFDELSVIEQLKRTEELDIVGGAHYVASLTNKVVSSARIEDHCRIVYEKFLLREQIRIYAEGLNACYESFADGFETLDDTSSRLITLSTKTERGNVTPIDAALVPAIQRIETLRNSKEDIIGVPTGFVSLDRVTHGWQAPDFIILAARPSVGKTAFALNLARNASLHPRKPTPVAIFSMEMSTGQLINRMLSAESEIWLEKITRGKLDDADMKLLYIKGIQPLAKAKIFIDDTPALNILELRAKCRKLKNLHGVGLIIVDYLQLMNGLGDGRNQNREQEIATISRGLKGLCKELNIPIIALSQLSREVEKRSGGKPQLSDLRESGAIEQDADVVMFLTRPDYQKEEGEVDPMLQHLADVTFRKHRNGTLETVPLFTRLEIQKFMEEVEYNDYNQKRDKDRGRLIPLKDALNINPKNYQNGTDDNPF